MSQKRIKINYTCQYKNKFIENHLNIKLPIAIFV